MGSGRIDSFLIFQGYTWTGRYISSGGIFYQIEKKTNIFCSKCDCAKVNVSFVVKCNFMFSFENSCAQSRFGSCLVKKYG